jgi:hypothetical protein
LAHSTVETTVLFLDHWGCQQDLSCTPSLRGKKGIAAILLGNDPDKLVRDLQDRKPSSTRLGSRKTSKSTDGNVRYRPFADIRKNAFCVAFVRRSENFHPIALVTLGRTIENFPTYA